MDRRRFLLASAASASLASCSPLRFFETTPVIHYPGMAAGHALRDAKSWHAPSAELATDVVILGSGVAGLMAAWKLAKAGHKNFMMISGPEFGGNAAGGAFGELGFPRGAHYLPLPSTESVHLREMLHDFGVLLDTPDAERPLYDEAAIVHSPDERLFFNGKWQDGLLPANDDPQHARFLSAVESLKTARGKDGKKVFAIPVDMSSRDEQWLRLDHISFAQWLTENGYTSPTLRWYTNYVCRDDYGTEYDKVSAWAGLHYFASRAGQAKNAADGAVLTWPEGLGRMVNKFRAAIDAHRGGNIWLREAHVVRVEETKTGVDILCAENSANGPRTFVVKAKRAVCAMPLFVVAKIFPQLKEYGFDSNAHLPSYAPWLVSNFLLKGFPAEAEGVPLAWDNVIYQGKGLGYVVSTHQDIRQAAPAKTVFTAYQALSNRSPNDVRQWLAKASPRELYDEAACELKQVYDWRWPLSVQALDITVRAHAMASPLVGFRANQGLANLRHADGKILFAHSDLSGFSVFEEASWWGYRAAQKILAG